MFKHFKQIKSLECVQEGGFRHFVAHLIGTERVSYCCILIGRRWTRGFIDGIEKAQREGGEIYGANEIAKRISVIGSSRNDEEN